MMRALLLLVCALIVSGSPVFGQNPTQVFSHKETGINFPAKLGHLELEGVKKYDNKALGVSVRYAGPHLLKADVYVYHMGLRGIPNGIESTIITNHFSQVVEEVKNMEETGRYVSVVSVSRGVTSVGAHPNLWPTLYECFTYQQKVGTSEPRKSYLLLTGYKGHFVKIRFTYLLRQEAEGEALRTEFLKDFGAYLR